MDRITLHSYTSNAIREDRKWKKKVKYDHALSEFKLRSGYKAGFLTMSSRLGFRVYPAKPPFCELWKRTCFDCVFISWV